MSKKKNNKKGDNKMENQNIEELKELVNEVEETEVETEEVEEVKDPEVTQEELEVITSTGETKKDFEGESIPRPEESEENESEENESEENESEENEEESNPIVTANGVVFGCAKLNVRIKPSKDSTVCYILNNGENVTVNITESTEEFYKVSTINMYGYCMKQFISIK